jgi:rRNA-processing protein Efg1
MDPPHPAKKRHKSNPKRIPPSTAPKGPVRKYTISKPWAPSRSGYNLQKNRERIRDIIRTLKHQNDQKRLPGHVRVNLERELRTLRTEEAIGRAEGKRQGLMRQEKKVKFFGMVNAT